MKIILVTDHYAMVEGDEVVGIITKAPSSNGSWQVRTLRGTVNGAVDYIPLIHAFEAAARWKP